MQISTERSFDNKAQMSMQKSEEAAKENSLEMTFEIESQCFSTMFHLAPACLGILKGPDHVFDKINRLGLQLIGKENIIGKTVNEVLPEVAGQNFIELLDEVYRTGKTFSANEMLFKLYKNNTGELVEKYLNFIYQAYKNVEGNVDGIFFFAIDVTEQVLSRKKIEESQKLFRQIVETSQEGIWMIDENNVTTFVNKRMCEILEYPEEEIIGRTKMFFKEEVEQIKTLQNIERRRQGIQETYESKFITKTNRHIWAQISANPIFDDNGTYKGALAMITDITEKKQLEQKLLTEQLERQKQISRAEIIAQEKERSDIGVELHDNINQLLAAGKLYLSYSLTLKENHQPLVFKTQEFLTMAIDEIRKLSKALVGPEIENPKGLIDSISELINDISIIKEIEFNFIHHEYDEATTEGGLKLVVYRIIQEQMNNILKHAEATNVNIELANITEGVQLIISDNGNGFDTNAHRPGIGLNNIKNRATIYDGTVEIISSPGNGCNMKILFKNCK